MTHPTPAPSSLTWTTEDGDYSVDPSASTAELLVANVGWSTARTLYTLSCSARDGRTTWRLLELDEAAPAPKDAALVVEVEQWMAQSGGEVHAGTNIRTWFVPKHMVSTSEALIGKGRAELGRLLLIDIALATDTSPGLSLPEGSSEELPGVPISSIPQFIHTYLRTLASDAASRGGFCVREPIAAAYRYRESEPGSNMNETVESSWIWRLGLPTNNGGVLTVEIDASDVDTVESRGPRHLGQFPRAWLALPGTPECVTWACPGVPLSVPSDTDNAPWPES